MAETKVNKASELTASVKTMIENLANETDAARQSDLFKSVLRAQAAFWDYSWCNQLLIWKQRQDATYVAGFNTWLKLDRHVRKGEKGIAILAPMFFKDKKAPQGVGAEQESGGRIWFKAVYVFDIAQTEGEDLPQVPTSSKGKRGNEMLIRMLLFAERRGIKVDFVEETHINGALGSTNGKGIKIRTRDQDVTTQASTLAHELAHMLLHFDSEGKRINTREGKEIDKRQRELEAEATAYCLCQRFGVESPSDFYLATYKVSPAMLLEAVGTIAATVKTIMSGCELSAEPEQVMEAAA